MSRLRFESKREPRKNLFPKAVPWPQPPIPPPWTPLGDWNKVPTSIQLTTMLSAIGNWLEKSESESTADVSAAVQQLIAITFVLVCEMRDMGTKLPLTLD